jgi:hypothetical protein
MHKISELTAEIAREREKIWQEAPPELESLKSHQKGRAGNVTVRVYAFADAYRNQRNLWLLRDGVKTQNLTVETAKSVLAPFLREMADRFEIWALITPSKLFRKVESRLAEVADPAELADLLDELLIYNNRWWLWLDSCIPWFDLDRKL